MTDLGLEIGQNLINYAQAARILGISRTIIYKLIARGQLHPIKVADRRYLQKHEVEQVLNERIKKQHSTNR